MRKLMWFAVGFAGAMALAAYCISSGALVALSLLMAAVCAGLFFVKKPVFRKFAVTCLGLCVGFAYFAVFDGLYLKNARQFDTQTVTAQVRISDYSYETNYGVAADGYITLNGSRFKVRVYVYAHDALRPADVVEGEFTLRYTVGSGENEPTYHRGNGIFLLAYAKEAVTITESEMNLLDRVAILRREILLRLEAAFDEDVEGFAKALLLGDTSGLDYETDTALRTSGIRHVAAVSGLHVSVLFGLVYLLAGKRRTLTALLGIPVLVVFCAVAGFSPSIVRACIMQILMILALLLNKEYDPPTALAFAVLAMLCVNPQSITSVSLQLSAGCMVGIFLFCQKISAYWLDDKRLGRFRKKRIAWFLLRWVCSGAAVTLSAMVTTVPLCAYYFGMISLVGILTNLLTLWAVSLIFYGIIAVLGIGLALPGVGALIAQGVAWVIRYVLGVARGLGSLPFAAVYTDCVYITIWLVLCYVLLVIFLLSAHKRPWIFTACVSAGLVFALLFSAWEAGIGDYEMTVLNVGQGQCIILRSEGRVYMVDCGGDTDEQSADLAAAYLLSRGIYQLDGVILTHYDRDHAGGLSMLLSRVGAKALYLPDMEPDSRIRRELEEAYSDIICWVGYEQAPQIAPDLTVISAKTGKTDNEGSLCILFQPQNYDILITADRDMTGERQLLQSYPIPDLEVLVVGHHGAANAAGFELLQHTQPELALISVGENRYGHPNEDTLQRLEMYGCRVYRTDLHGNIILKG